jgi:hypothetical protein
MFARDVALPKEQEYVSPDGSLVLPAWRVLRRDRPITWATAGPTRSTRTASASARVGERVVFTNGSENRTFSGLIGAGGAITDLKQVGQPRRRKRHGGPAGNVYVANGQVFVYGRTARRSAASTCRNVRCS